jgi:N-methylhydantoinase B
MTPATSGQSAIDPITFEVLRNAFDAISDEMAYTVVRSARSTMIKDCMDFSAALCSADGDLIAQAVTIPLMMCAIPDALRAILRKFGDDIAPGDCIILSDPYEGGSHLPDIFMFTPVFVDERLIAFSATCAHHADVGGMTPGSGSSDATEIFQEGIRIPVVKLYDAGHLNQPLIETLERNVRFPSMYRGDLEAQRAACLSGEREFLNLVRRYGADTLTDCIGALLDYAERLCRSEIEDFPDGIYEFTDFIDEDGLDPDPIPIHLRLTIEGDRVNADFSDSAPQVRGSLNCSLSFTKACVFTAIKCFCRGEIPPNSGFFRPIEVIAPEGTVLNVAFPGATFMRGLTGYRVNNVLFGALAQAMPDRAIAADEGGTTIVAMDGYDTDGERFLYMETISGAWGGRANLDGIDCASNVTGLQSNTPVEVLETEYPIEVVQYGFVPDTGGAGRTRGGLGLVREYRYLADAGSLQIRADRVRFAPYGLFGGEPGGKGKNQMNAAGKNIPLAAKVKKVPLAKGDTVRHELAGGGGYGWSFERDTELVLEDVLNDKVSLAAARKEYGVVLDTDPLAVDKIKTAKARDKLRRAVDPSRPPVAIRESTK